MKPRTVHRVAVVGAGMSGLACATALARADVEVVLFDKSRGVGGRMATRRSRWRDAAGVEHEAAFDHGCTAFTAHAPSFVDAVQDAARRGWLASWSPHWSATSFRALDVEDLWLPVPSASAWCRQMAQPLPVRLEQRIGALQRDEDGWRLAIGDELGERFSHVVVAVPPAQAAELVTPHRSDWGRRAALWTMQPCWTLMGVAESTSRTPAWEATRPQEGPLALLMCNETRPGRAAADGRTLWVAQATAGWSRTNLEAPEDNVRAALQEAVAALLGHRPEWLASWVHRWRYAHAPRHGERPTTHACWYDEALALGLCGDYLGGSGVEGAWLSGQALAADLLAGSGLHAGGPSRR